MLQQYLSMKRELKNTLLFFRLGDFYELFFEDAKIAASELDLVLTARAAGNNQKAPMCGVPHHALSSYLQRLITKGYKVAIAEQMEDPATAKGLVKREITKIVTPGLNIDQDENVIATVASIEEDLLNYHIVVFNLNNNHVEKLTIESDRQMLLLTLYQYGVVEVILDDLDLLKYLKDKSNLTISIEKVEATAKDKKVDIAYRRLLSYLEYTQKQRVKPFEVETENRHLQIDYATSINLELFVNLRHQTKKNTLWLFLDQTKSSMGSRRLREWISKPLMNQELIELRQDKIAYLVDNFLVTHQIGEQLSKMYDIQKITTKLSYGSVTAQDLNRLKKSLIASAQLKDLLDNSPITEISELTISHDLINLLDNRLNEEAPLNLKDGGTINDGVNKELDDYRSAINHSNDWLLNYEATQKEKTGIKNLKVGYSRAFGYYIEVSKSQVAQVREDFGYTRRQTLTNGQRYITIELKEQEDKISVANQNILELETQLFNDLVADCKQYIEQLDDLATRIADTDVLYALSQISSQSGYVRPTFHQGRSIDVVDSYHPILEMTLKQHEIIANNVHFDDNEDIMILTGPNMGGKSTYMRQVALLVIMAQMGCYVRATKASLPIFDAIYTRMGASDDIMMGQSTFMIEMSEANYALSFATEKSLILFDEIGRGTSTYDGMAIATAIIEYIAINIKAKCIFSTHYHEMTSLAEQLDNVSNYRVDVQEENDKVTFMYHVVRGSADKSYGIHVAKLAQLPYPLILRANQHLENYQNGNGTSAKKEIVIEQSDLEKELINEITKHNINDMTPLAAHALLAKLTQKIQEQQDE